MDRLWAPWRVTYLSAIHKPPKTCVFCRILRANEDRRHLIFTRTEHSFAVLNLYPYNNGHTLVMPRRHVADWGQMTPAEKLDLLELLSTTQKLLKKILHPGGFNVGANIGKAAGAGFPGHLHIHVVPRWNGDVNFMPVLTKTKVISQSLEALYRLLVVEQKKIRVTLKRMPKRSLGR